MHILSSTQLPTRYGDFQFTVFRSGEGESEHILLQYGILPEAGPVLVRVHSECITGEVFSSLKCDCGYQLHTSMDMLAKNHSGLLLYLRQQGRGIGLVDKIRAYALQEQGMNTVEANIALGLEADHRNYDAAVDVLSTLGITKVKLITNNPHKMEALTEKGIEVVERVPIQVVPDQHTRGYLETKRDIFGHWLD